MDNFEKFLHSETPLPVLIHCGLAHAQFETIHPFLDGNGRVGRLLITFLCQRVCCASVTSCSARCSISVSTCKRHRSEYYDRLMAVRLEGNWEAWLKFFLQGVAETSLDATRTARSILHLREEGRRRILLEWRNAGLPPQLFDLMFEHPVVTVRWVEQHLGCSYAKANQLVEQFASPSIGDL